MVSEDDLPLAPKDENSFFARLFVRLGDGELYVWWPDELYHTGNDQIRTVSPGRGPLKLKRARTCEATRKFITGAGFRYWMEKAQQSNSAHAAAKVALAVPKESEEAYVYSVGEARNIAPDFVLCTENAVKWLAWDSEYEAEQEKLEG